MKSERLTQLMLSSAEEIRRLSARVEETARLRDQSAEHRLRWEAACEAFHSQYDALAFPGGYSSALERILHGDANAIEAALCFLEARPYFFRSGYMYKDILRKIKRAPLSQPQAARLAQITAAYTQYRAARSHGV